MQREGRIGVFGGSFDPIHLGHLILAQNALETLELDRVFFVPTAVPPHKKNIKLSPFPLRVKMVELALAGNDAFELSLMESGEDPSYTYETVLRFKEEGYEREQLHLLVGSDSLQELEYWRRPEVIFENATIVSMMRPGFEAIPPLPRGASVVILERGSNSISSTDIRELVREGKSIKYLVPDGVEKFIKDNSLYI